MPFPLPKGKPEFSKLEESILQYWKEDKTFEKSVEFRPAENPYRFYDGPPFITGTPHYGSLLSSIIKDVIPRYQTMLGKRVERVWGWDCHGLPIEQKVQKKLGLESNKEIEESAGGIQKFIDECYAYTRETSSEWNWYVDHIGRWVDMDHAYRTMDQDYMESVMWVFKQIWEKGYVYEGKRVSWYSWKLSTPISNFEIAMDDSYQDVQDPAVTIKFPVLDVKKSASFVIQDEDGKVMMMRNKKDGLWRFGGGHVEKGEDHHTAAMREMLEETGLTCELKPYCTVLEEYRGTLFEAYVYRGTVPVGTKVKLEEDVCSEYEYFPLDALPVREDIHPMNYGVIDCLAGIREPILLPEIPERKVSFLAWTTTPWTLPMHMAIAVNDDLTYATVLYEDELYILAQSRVETVFKGKGDYTIVGTMPGKYLTGLHYQAPFDFYQGKIPSDKNFIVYHADFVTDTDGTGIAHEAPEFGDVDFQLAKEKGIHITAAIDEAGKYTAEVPDYVGQLYLDCIDPICERLKAEGTLFKKESITHRVPYCPRSNTPLIQKAQKSWFIDIQRIKKELIEKNESINWFPDHFKHGRFLKSLESAPDWCISRSRFWGTPMPVWQNSDGSERVVIDSREELFERNKPLGQITKFIFVRHGESEGNIGKFFAKPETPLTNNGQEQAKKLIEELKNEKIDVIISSPFLRTLETAKPIAKKLGIEIVTDDRIREWDVGDFLGIASDTIEAKEDARKCYSELDYIRGKTGETQQQVRDRGENFLREINAKYAGKTVAFFSHNGFGKIFFSALRDESYRMKNFKNCEVRKFYIDNNTGKEINLHRPYIDRIYVPGKSSFTPKKVLGVHGYNKKGDVVDFFATLKSSYEIQGISVVAPFFQSGEKADYKTWEKVFEENFSDDIDTVVTHSMGARAAIEYIIAHKKKLHRIVFIAPSLQSRKPGNVQDFYDSLKEDVSTLRLFVSEIIVISSEDDVGREGKAKAFAGSVGANHIEVNGVGHFNTPESKFIEHIVMYGAPMKRIPEVLDVWMDSASMPYAQVHYPFENEVKMEASFPADFIAEYTGQIRAWFYVMHVIGVLVKGSPAFKNVAVTGVINGTDGRKMSKSFGNYPDPRETIEKYGADAIRFYLMSGPIMRGEDMNFSETGIAESIKRVLLPLWNSYTFFATYANIDGWEFKDYKTKKTHELDTWIISRLHTLIQDVRSYMDSYDLQKTCDAIMVFLDGLNNWYIRRNRRRFWRSELDADKKSAYETLHEVLVTMTKLLAPICPFLSEHLYQNLMNTTDSVHLTDFPEENKKLINKAVNQKMTDLQSLTNLGLAIRGREKLRVRQPLRSASITLDLDESARAVLAEELNVKEIHTISNIADYVTITYSPDAKKIGATERKQWMKTIIADAKSGKGTLLANGTLELSVPEAPDKKVILASDEYEAIYTPKEGSTIAFAGNAGYVIGLDTTLDEALTLEGYARDMIRAIQDARKELGFQVTDRLQLSLTSENIILAQILATHQDMIEKETLTKIAGKEHGDSREAEIDEGFIVQLILQK